MGIVEKKMETTIQGWGVKDFIPTVEHQMENLESRGSQTWFSQGGNLLDIHECGAKAIGHTVNSPVGDAMAYRLPARSV